MPEERNVMIDAFLQLLEEERRYERNLCSYCRCNHGTRFIKGNLLICELCYEKYYEASQASDDYLPYWETV